VSEVSNDSALQGRFGFFGHVLSPPALTQSTPHRAGPWKALRQSAARYVEQKAIGSEWRSVQPKKTSLGFAFVESFHTLIVSFQLSEIGVTRL
jgi:hypothetical protein